VTRLRVGLVLAVFVVLALGVAVAFGRDDGSEPEGVPSAQGLYRVAFETDPAGSPVNRLHTWAFALRDGDGDPVSGAQVSVDGDMPAHGHGLPTRPLVREVGDGAYVIEGMKFQMGGRWFVELRIDGPDGSDRARVDFELVG
jgi:hypothetical protein